MPFLDTVLGFVTGRRADPAPAREEGRRKAAEAWGLTAVDMGLGAAEPGSYDWQQWRKKVARILAGLPATEPEWAPMMAEARALAFGDERVLATQIEEFTLLVRRAVADCEFTEPERLKLDLARRLIGIADSDAEALVQTVIREAEVFFGQQVHAI